jgi:hypothetical protein
MDFMRVVLFGTWLWALAGCTTCPTSYEIPAVPLAEWSAFDAIAWPAMCASVESSNPDVASMYLDEHTLRVQAGAPGSADLIVRHHETGEVLSRATFTVFAVRRLELLSTGSILEAEPLRIARDGADGSRYVGPGGLTCEGYVSVYAAPDCSVIAPGTPVAAGSGTVRVYAARTRDWLIRDFKVPN